MTLPPFTTVCATLQGGVLTLALNRPEVRNAMSLAMVNELLQALHTAEQTPEVRAIVLRGSNGHFCAGGDIGDMARARMSLDAHGVPDAVAHFNAQFGRLCLAYARTGLPVVTVLEGAVMGGGFGLACVSDVSLALDTTVFRLPETSLGVIPAQIAPFLVERLGYSEARRLAITGARLGAREALTLRLVHEVHADATALESALAATLAQVLGCAPRATAATKALLARARHTDASELIDHAAALFSHAVLGDEGQEGTAAFMHKRPPRWATPHA